MVRRLSLVLLGIVTASSAVTAAPTVPAVAVAVPVVGAAPIPTIDFAHLFNRLTVPLGTVPVRD